MASLAPFDGSEGLTTRATRAVKALLARQALQDLQALALHPAATPFVPLLEALAGDLGVAPADPRLQACAEATLLSYLHVRVQDDVVDEPDRWDRSFTFVADGFAAASVEAFARATSGPLCADFFAFRTQQLHRFFAAAVTELDGRRDDAPLDERRLAEKFLPLAVCLGALAFGARRPELARPLTSVVLGVGEALQRANDLLNVSEDWREGRRTPALEALRAEGGLTPGAPPRLVLLQSRALGEELGRAQSALRWAGQLADTAGLRGVATLVAGRQAFLRSVPERLLQLQLGGGLR